MLTLILLTALFSFQNQRVSTLLVVVIGGQSSHFHQGVSGKGLGMQGTRISREQHALCIC